MIESFEKLKSFGFPVESYLNSVFRMAGSHNKSSVSHKTELVTLLLALPVLILLLQHLFRKYWRANTLKCFKKQSILEKRWDELPRVSFLRALWICRDKRNIFQSFRQLAKKYGMLARVTVLGEEYVCLNSPALAEKLLSSRNLRHSAKPSQLYENVFDMIGNGVITSKGEFWHSQRKLLSKGFTYTALRKYTKIYNKCAKRVVKELSRMFAGSETEYKPINPLIQTGGIEIIAETVMGLDTTQHKEDATFMFESLNRFKELAFQRLASGWLVIPFFWKLHPLSRKYGQCITNIEGVIKSMIKRFQKQFQLDLKTGKKQEDDCFDNLMELMVKSDFSEDVVLDETKTMIMAGYETVSATMQFLIFMLALHQNHQIACREEIDSIFIDPSKCPEGNLTMEALSEMKHLERCLLETLRMFPVAFHIGRQLEAPLKIDEELIIPAGVNAIIPILLFHMSEDNFPQPDEFQPERFLPENCVKRHPFAYQPFSAGPRACVGMKFSLLEAKTIVAHILRNFEVYTSDKIDDVAIIPSILLRPERDYLFRLKKRNLEGNM